MGANSKLFMTAMGGMHPLHKRQLLQKAAGQVVHVGTAGETASPEGGTAGAGKHRKSGWNPEWLQLPQFKHWLYVTPHGMFCHVCRQHRPAVKNGPKLRPFVEVGAVHYRKDYLEHHINTEHHQHSIKCHNSIVSGYSVMHAFEPIIIMEHEAVIGGFKCLYWLVKNEIAHHTNYGKLLSLAQLLGCDYFLKLKIDRRNNYRSHRIIDEMLEIVSTVIEEPLMEQMRASQAISLELDESTDVSLIRQLDLHIRYLDKEGLVFNQFLDIVTVCDGKADTIVTAVKAVLQNKQVPTEKLCGLSTDGAAVMTGRVNGVAKQLTDSFPMIVAVACAAHRLALACKDASNDVKYMGTFRDHLQELHLFFHHSANRTAALKAAATTLGLSDLKIKEVKDTRWLSQHLAIEVLQTNLKAVLATLAEEAEIKRCPIAKGLYTFCATYRFVASVYLQADILPHLARLSKVFQQANVNFLHIKEQVPITIETLRRIKDAGETPLPGSFLSRLHQDLDDPLALGAFMIHHEEERNRRGHGVEDLPREEHWTKFVKEVASPYISGLLHHLERRFQNLHIIGAFSIFGPQAAALADEEQNNHLQTLAKRFLPGKETLIFQEWQSFKEHMRGGGAFKDKNQAEIMTLLASECDEWGQIYPLLSRLAAIALVIPVSSVNCERDFSTMNRVKSDLRNRLQEEHLAACLRVSINGPCPEEFNYQRALELFFSKPRKIQCPNSGCKVCK
ncbi:zinc finger protein 862-like isoform X3 [Acanthopagrus latus]|uniref:zinc finger protein 862-like isoform X3 n=1 Tax=Acanthopagrus latus TaxID=8177 RepID=UPI00187C9BD2|nr:zinc finger protein 862-like isoform X3 [Acanthopagrus latus]